VIPQYLVENFKPPFVFSLVASVTGAAYKFGQHTLRANRSFEQTDRMATNHVPHMEGALRNMDINIARMSGGQPANYDDLDRGK